MYFSFRLADDYEAAILVFVNSQAYMEWRASLTAAARIQSRQIQSPAPTSFSERPANQIKKCEESQSASPKTASASDQAVSCKRTTPPERHKKRKKPDKMHESIMRRPETLHD